MAVCGVRNLLYREAFLAQKIPIYDRNHTQTQTQPGETQTQPGETQTQTQTQTQTSKRFVMHSAQLPLREETRVLSESMLLAAKGVSERYTSERLLLRPMPDV